MPKYQKFEDLPVWQEAARLYNRVLDLLEEPQGEVLDRSPPPELEWGLPIAMKAREPMEIHG